MRGKVCKRRSRAQQSRLLFVRRGRKVVRVITDKTSWALSEKPGPRIAQGCAGSESELCKQPPGPLNGRRTCKTGVLLAFFKKNKILFYCGEI